MNKDNTEIGIEILCACRNELYMCMPYLNEALCALSFVPGGEVTVSAATNGTDLYYDSNFLSDKYIRSSCGANRLYLHMVLHCMLCHLPKKRGHDGALWDIACDAAVESIIDSLPHRSVSRGTRPLRQKFYGECLSEMKTITAEAVYRMLLRERKSEYELAVLQKEFLEDDHGLWDMPEHESSENCEKKWKDISSRTQTSMESMLSEKADGGENILEQVRIAARDDVDYRAFLRRFASPREIMKCDGDAFDYIYYTFGLSRYGNMPLIEPPETKEEKRIEDFVIAIDTSMSTSGELVREFLRCTYSILMSTETFTRKLNIRIIQCDNEIRSDTVIHSLDELKKYMNEFQLSGGSATDFRPVFEYVDALKKEGAFTSLRGLIYFTDSMGIYPKTRPDYEAAFVLLEEPPLEYKMPPWAIKLVLDYPAIEKAGKEAEEYWAEETLEEMPDL